MNHRGLLIATRGLPASGKTTWALTQLREHPLWVRCNRDDIRRMVHGSPRYDRKSEALITSVQYAVLCALFDRPAVCVIVDDTNLNPAHMSRLEEYAELVGAEFRVQDFTHVPLEICIGRDQARPVMQRVGETLIREMRERWLM